MTDKDVKTVRGRCLCGGVAFEATDRIRNVVYCHCKQCRSWHGNYIGYSGCAEKNLRFTSDRTLKWYASSEDAKRGFCTDCGSSLFWKANQSDGICFTAGCLEEPTGITSESHIYVGSAGDSYELTDGLPKYEESD